MKENEVQVPFEKAVEAYKESLFKAVNAEVMANAYIATLNGLIQEKDVRIQELEQEIIKLTGQTTSDSKEPV